VPTGDDMFSGRFLSGVIAILTCAGKMAARDIATQHASRGFPDSERKSARVINFHGRNCFVAHLMQTRELRAD
jgi:hypothetical protein